MIIMCMSTSPQVATGIAASSRSSVVDSVTRLSSTSARLLVYSTNTMSNAVHMFVHVPGVLLVP